MHRHRPAQSVQRVQSTSAREKNAEFRECVWSAPPRPTTKVEKKNT